uniref:Microsomal prostaglandin-E synthase 2 (PTGES2) n=1 Tax=uncultured marine group II/III euryarchaeote KM3_80_G12 TaxID=1456515 RepID=A0A075HW74_9EURY|nr:microsomal prostaglandin-E synthase 2 (PTGES2) [uncultured marine group II/III euryarchaeote KM3_80_G12]
MTEVTPTTTDEDTGQQLQSEDSAAEEVAPEQSIPDSGAAQSGPQADKVAAAVVDQKPTLYCFETCPFCWKVRSLLAWKGVAYSKVEVDPLKKGELGFSDWKAVPVFVDSDGTQVNDSNDILEWINSNHEGATSFPAAGTDAEQERWMEFSNAVLGKSIVPVIYRTFGSSLKALAYVTSVEKFGRWQAWKAKWIGAFVMRMIGRSRAKLWDLPPEANLAHQLDELATGIEGDFLGGDSPDGGDFANYGMLRSMQGLRGFDIVEGHSSIGPWYGRMQSTSGV